MKVFVIFLMTVVAIVMANPTWNQQSSLQDILGEGNQQAHEQRHQQWNEWSKNSPSWNNDNNSNEMKPNSQRQRGSSWQEQSWNEQSNPSDSSDSNEDQPLNSQQRKSQHSHHHNDDDNAANVVDIQPFRTKIMRRLEESQQLSNQPEITKKITKLVEDKIDACKHQSVGNKGKADRHCLGRATGQMMQMIAAFESGTRNLPNSYDF